MSDYGWVVSMTFDVSDGEQAKTLARHLARSVSSAMPSLQPETTVVSPEGMPSRISWCFCGLLLERDKRCMLPSRHLGEHSPDWPEG